MGSGGQQQSTSQNKPLPITDPYIAQYLSDLGILDNPFSGTRVPQQQIAGLSDLQNRGLGAMGQEATQSGVLGNQAQKDANKILGGGYLDPSTNKYLRSFYQSAAAPMVQEYQMGTAPSITAQDVQQGGLGGSGQNQEQQYSKWQLGNNLQSLAAGIYEPAYQQGLNQMTSVLGMTPSLQQAAFTPSQQLMQGGALQQQQEQNRLNALYGNQQAQFQFPYQQLGQYGSGVQGMASLGGQNVSFNPGGGSVK